LDFSLSSSNAGIPDHDGKNLPDMESLQFLSPGEVNRLGIRDHGIIYARKRVMMQFLGLVRESRKDSSFVFTKACLICPIQSG
jgi:hypothetical protein